MKINVGHLSWRSFFVVCCFEYFGKEKVYDLWSSNFIFWNAILSGCEGTISQSIVCTSQMKKKENVSLKHIWKKDDSIFSEKRLDIVTCVRLKTFIYHRQSVLWFFMPLSCLFYVQIVSFHWGHSISPLSIRFLSLTQSPAHILVIAVVKFVFFFFISEVNPRSTSRTTSPLAEVCFVLFSWSFVTYRMVTLFSLYFDTCKFIYMNSYSSFHKLFWTINNQIISKCENN